MSEITEPAEHAEDRLVADLGLDREGELGQQQRDGESDAAERAGGEQVAEGEVRRPRSRLPMRSDDPAEQP